MPEHEAYKQGVQACYRGEDGRYTNPHRDNLGLARAWSVGFASAFNREDDDDEPDAELDGCPAP